MDDSYAIGETIYVGSTDWSNARMFLTDIDHVQIAAPKGCEPAARKFFGGLLNLEEIEKPAPLRARGGCWFQVGSRQLHIGVEEPFRPAEKAHPAFAVLNAEALFSTLAAAGVLCMWDQALEGVRRFYAHDPWGNRLEFIETHER
jgi:catechol 2,3-dioxygenase-like lactoylglutathione lyase family enzyme